MRRSLLVITVAAVAVMINAPTADAAATQVVHFRLSGATADPDWLVGTATDFTDTFVSVSSTTTGPELVVDDVAVHLDADGNLVSATETLADVTTGFSYSIDAVKLSAASVSATSVPATTCAYDATGQQTGCTDSAVDLSGDVDRAGPGRARRHERALQVRWLQHQPPLRWADT